jgi:predicted Zn-dependent protease
MNHRKTTPALRSLAIAVVCAFLLAGCATTTSSTGRKQYVGGVSQDQLDLLGGQAFAQIKGQKSLSADARQSAYVGCVVDAIVSQLPSPSPDRQWEHALFIDKSPNAFALPGGKVGVNTGILDIARNQDQLAAVIGHEVGHVLERHHDERITRQMGASSAVQVLGILAAARYGQSGAQVATQGGSLLVIGGFLLPGTRQQEGEADVVGQRLMAEAGFDPRQAAGLWRNMIAASGRDGRAPDWLSTHPDPASRIGALEQRAESLMPLYDQARAAGRRPRCS